jgi:hypothetical protein
MHGVACQNYKRKLLLHFAAYGEKNRFNKKQDQAYGELLHQEVVTPKSRIAIVILYEYGEVLPR